MKLLSRAGRERARSRLLLIALAGSVLASLTAGPAAAGTGIDGVRVLVDSPTSRAQDIRWLLYDPVAQALPAGATSVRYTFPSQVTATDVDPATAALWASGAGTTGCPVTTAGLRMEGWDLVVDPAALLATPLAACIGEPFFALRVSGDGAFDSLDLAVVLYLAPGGAPAEVRVDLSRTYTTHDRRTFVTAPAHAAPGVVLDLVATPRFFENVNGLRQVHLVDAHGASLADVTAATSIPFGAARLTVPLPAELPAGTAGVRVSATDGSGGAIDIAVPFVDPVTDPIEGYVTSVYEDLLARAPEPGGLAGWGRALREGVPPAAVADGITASDEFRGRLIDDAYARYLGRGADPQGRADWLRAMRSGLPIQSMESGFLGSVEQYLRAGGTDQGWVRSLYADVLGRSPSDAEIASWTTALARGADRYHVARGFMYSTEHLSGVVDGYYGSLLHRRSDPAGVATWVRAIQAGARTEQIIAGIVASAEYRANVPRR